MQRSTLTAGRMTLQANYWVTLLHGGSSCVQVTGRRTLLSPLQVAARRCQCTAILVVAHRHGRVRHRRPCMWAVLTCQGSCWTTLAWPRLALPLGDWAPHIAQPPALRWLPVPQCTDSGCTPARTRPPPPAMHVGSADMPRVLLDHPCLAAAGAAPGWRTGRRTLLSPLHGWLLMPVTQVVAAHLNGCVRHRWPCMWAVLASQGSCGTSLCLTGSWRAPPGDWVVLHSAWLPTAGCRVGASAHLVAAHQHGCGSRGRPCMGAVLAWHGACWTSVCLTGSSCPS